MMRRLGMLAGAAIVAAGCGTDIEGEINRILGSDYDITVSQESPDITVNVSEQVTKLEDKINSDGGSNRQILVTLCKADPAATTCDTDPRFPVRIPRYIWPAGYINRSTNPPTLVPAANHTTSSTCDPTDPALVASGTVSTTSLPPGNGCVDVSAWLMEVDGVEELTKIAQAVKFDLSEKGSLKDVSQVRKVTVQRVTFKFKENSFPYAVPTTEMFVGKPVSDEEVRVAKQLIADQKVTLFGTLSNVTAMFTGNRNMQLEAAGKAVLSDAIRGFKATLAAQAQPDIPPETDAAREDNCKMPGHLVTERDDYCESFAKPGGTVKFSVEMEVTFTVRPSG
ncbi:MAG: hypothetical protein HY904_02905 [Deltaproteobacteria bacterium]|nr:hypothetical protein [Deltaproteobacteria bacterium]